MKRIVIASEDNRGLDGVVSAHFGRCPCYTVVEVEGPQMVSHKVEMNPHHGNHRPGQMPQYIHSLGANVILAGGMGPMAIDMFNKLGIDVATGVVGSVREAVKSYLDGTLRGIVPCEHDHPDSCGAHGHDHGHAGQAHPAPKADDAQTKGIASGTVVVPATSDGGLTARMDPRFGRAPWFLVVDIQTGKVVETLTNENAAAAHGAGTGAAAQVARSGAGAVIAGHFGPKAQQALQGLGMTLWTSGEGLTVGEAVDRLRSGALHGMA